MIHSRTGVWHCGRRDGWKRCRRATRAWPTVPYSPRAAAARRCALPSGAPRARREAQGSPPPSGRVGFGAAPRLIKKSPGPKGPGLLRTVCVGGVGFPRDGVPLAPPVRWRSLRGRHLRRATVVIVHRITSFARRYHGWRVPTRPASGSPRPNPRPPRLARNITPILGQVASDVNRSLARCRDTTHPSRRSLAAKRGPQTAGISRPVL